MWSRPAPVVDPGQPYSLYLPAGRAFGRSQGRQPEPLGAILGIELAEARPETVVQAIHHAAGGTAIGVAADCTDPAAVERLRRQVEQDLGRAEVLEHDWHSTVDGSLTATFQTLKSFLPGMIKRGRGAIMTMASSAARLPGLSAPAPYMAAKAV